MFVALSTCIDQLERITQKLLMLDNNGHMGISEQIHRVLKEKGLTYYEAGKRSGLTQEGVRKIAEGITQTPRIDTLQKLSQALGLTVSELIGEQEPPREIGRSPCESWNDLRLCLIDLGLSESIADLGIKQLRDLADYETPTKRSGRHTATG